MISHKSCFFFVKPYPSQTQLPKGRSGRLRKNHEHQHSVVPPPPPLPQKSKSSCSCLLREGAAGEQAAARSMMLRMLVISCSSTQVSALAPNSSLNFLSRCTAFWKMPHMTGMNTLFLGFHMAGPLRSTPNSISRSISCLGTIRSQKLQSIAVSHVNWQFTASSSSGT